MSGRLERRAAACPAHPVGGNCDERTILSVFIRTANAFVDDRQRTLAVLARALGDQLFDPESQRRQRRRQDHRQLVAPCEVVAPMNEPSSNPAFA